MYNRRNFISENFVILTSNLHFLCLAVLFCFGLARALLSDGHLRWLFLIIILFVLFLIVLGRMLDEFTQCGIHNTNLLCSAAEQECRQATSPLCDLSTTHFADAKTI